MTSTDDIKKWLNKQYSTSVKFNEPMSSHTTFKTGGPAEIFVTPFSKNDAIAILNRAREKNVPVMIVGGGSNLIVSDMGIKGLVVSLAKATRNITVKETENNEVIVNAGSGVKTHDLCRFAVKKGLRGMNFAIGIPGTVGGSICMNAGTATGEMKGPLYSLNILNGSGTLKNIEKNNLNFSYRTLDWGNISPDPVIFSASFLLKKEKAKKESV